MAGVVVIIKGKSIFTNHTLVLVMIIIYQHYMHMTELIMCKSIRYTYYCEELFVMKHKSKHSCVNVIFYDLGPKVVVRICHFDYIYNMTVPPDILDGAQKLLLANIHGCRSLKCNSEKWRLIKTCP